MNFIQKWYIRKIKWAWDNFHYINQENMVEPMKVTGSTVSLSNSVSAKTSIRFTIYPASGGWVIEHYKQNIHKDSEGPELTIVNNSDKLGEAVEHIITMEALKS